MAKLKGQTELERLDRAASKLAPVERQVLLLSARDKLRNEQIAERLGLAAEEVERHLAEAIYELARELDRAERR